MISSCGRRDERGDLPRFRGARSAGACFRVSARGEDRGFCPFRGAGATRAKGGSVLCTIAGWRHVRKGRQPIIAGGGRGNTTRPRQEGRRGRGTTAGSPADRSGGSSGGSGALSGVVHRGVVVLLGKFVPADVRDAHLRLDQQGLIDVLNDRFDCVGAWRNAPFSGSWASARGHQQPAASNVATG